MTIKDLIFVLAIILIFVAGLNYFVWRFWFPKGVKTKDVKWAPWVLGIMIVLITAEIILLINKP